MRAVILFDEVGGVIATTVARDLAAFQGAGNGAFKSLCNLPARCTLAPVPLYILGSPKTVAACHIRLRKYRKSKLSS